MPYKIKHRGSGFKVTTPNHPGGFSKHSLSKKKAVAQLRAIKMNTKECAGTIVATLLNEEELAVVQFVSPSNIFWWYTATTGELWTREDTRAKLLPASKANEIVQNLEAIPAYRGRVGAIARNQPSGAPPNADITRLKKYRLADELKESQSCECRDPGCPVCGGQCNRTAKVNLRRVDMQDETGTFFCDQCAGDALDAGVFGSPHVGNFIRYHGRTPRLKAPPKADIMPGGGVGNPVGDNTAIGVGGGGGV